MEESESIYFTLFEIPANDREYHLQRQGSITVFGVVLTYKLEFKILNVPASWGPNSTHSYQ